MARRKATAKVQVPIRMLERLRAQLEKSAKARGASLNGEIVHRLEQSLQTEKLLEGFSEVLFDVIMEATDARKP